MSAGLRLIDSQNDPALRASLSRSLEHLVAKLDEANDAVAARIAAAPDDAAAAAVALDCPEWTAVKAKIRESKQRLLRVGYTEIAIDLSWPVVVKPSISKRSWLSVVSRSSRPPAVWPPSWRFATTRSSSGGS